MASLKGVKSNYSPTTTPLNGQAVGKNIKKKTVKIKQELEAEQVPPLEKSTRKKGFRPKRNKYAQIVEMGQNLEGETMNSENEIKMDKESIRKENKETIKCKKEEKQENTPLKIQPLKSTLRKSHCPIKTPKTNSSTKLVHKRGGGESQKKIIRSKKNNNKENTNLISKYFEKTSKGKIKSENTVEDMTRKGFGQ